MIGIYKITNKVNGKVYIGQSWDIETRIKNHRSHTHNEHLLNAMKKYGTNSFTFETIITFKDGPFTQNYLNKFEKYFVQQYDALNEEKGYNIKEGGQFGPIAEETKQKISKTLTGKKQSEETKKKRSISNTGKKRTPEFCKMLSEMMIGRHPVTEECKEKQRLSHLGKKQSPELIAKRIAHQYGVPLSKEHKEKLRDKKNKIGKKVICLDTDEVFDNAYKASIKYEINQKQMTACCRGEQPTCGGYHWKYSER